MPIDKKFLEEMKLPEDAITKILGEYDIAIKQETAKYSDYDTIKTNYVNQGVELENLKKLEPETLAAKIDTMVTEHKQAVIDLQQAHSETIKKLAVKMQLSNAHDPDLVLSQFDLAKIELDDKGNVKAGFKEQFEQLQTEKAFLFKVQEQQTFKGVTPQDGTTPPQNTTFASRLAEAREKGNNMLAFQIISEAAENGEQLR